MTNVGMLWQVVFWVLVVVEGVLIVGLHYQVEILEQALPRLDPSKLVLNGKPALPFKRRDVKGTQTVSLATFRAQRGILLFLGANCDSCIELARSLALVPPGMSSLIVAVSGKNLEAVVPDHIQCVGDHDRSLARLYQIRVVPAAVLINETGIVVRTVFPASGSEVVELLNLVSFEEPAIESDRSSATRIAVAT